MAFTPSKNYTQAQYDACVAFWEEQRARNQPAYDERIARWRKETAEKPKSPPAGGRQDHDSIEGLLSLPG